MEKQDRIIKFLAYNKKVLVVCARTTKLVEKARKIHDLSPTVTAAFGRALTMTAIMGADMKSQKDRLTIQIKGDGPVGTIVTVSDNTPNVKGYVSNPLAELPKNEDSKLDVGGVVGHTGFLNIIKDIGLKEPYIGISPLISGEIAEDFANYFVNSEQKQAAVALGVLVDGNGIKESGGYAIYPMPDATEEDISKIEQSIFKAGAISKMLDNDFTLQEIAKKITGDDKIEIVEENIMPKYNCDCSKEHLANGLKTIGKEELETILKEDGKAELVCHFCNSKYLFNEQEIKEIIKEIEKEGK